MGIKRRHPLRVKIRTIAGIVLVLASLAEILGMAGESGTGIEERGHLFFALIAAVGAISILLDVRYAPYTVLPVALVIFFYIVYRTVSTEVSLYSAVSGISFLISALLCFMLIRAHKI